MSSDRPSSTNSKTTAASPGLTTRTNRAEASIRRVSPSSPRPVPRLAVPSVGQRTPERLSTSDQFPVFASSSTSIEGLSSFTALLGLTPFSWDHAAPAVKSLKESKTIDAKQMRARRGHGISPERGGGKQAGSSNQDSLIVRHGKAVGTAIQKT